jgi:AcrR family transcriptional regulator
MARWAAGADARLARAAIELYLERGFEQVTVAEIAARAGLTKRTFFRYFPDKREVLFAGSAAFQDAVVSAVTGAPDGVAPIDAVAAALAAAGAGLTQLGEPVRRRQNLIAASADLQEREMIKLAALTAAIAAALRQRGLTSAAATLTAQAGIAVFTTAFERWASENGPVDFPPLVHEALSDLRTAIGAQ